MFARIRLGLHKHAKEGLTCLLESCTQQEYERVGASGCCILARATRVVCVGFVHACQRAGARLLHWPQRVGGAWLQLV